jgi:hypothetical protein
MLLEEPVGPQKVKESPSPHILQNRNVHYPAHKSLSFVAFLSQMNPVHTLPYYFFKLCFILYFNVFLGFFTWSFYSQIFSKFERFLEIY